MSQKSFELKSNLPSIVIMRLYSNDIAQFKIDLRAKVKTAPMMFIGMQLIIDMSEFAQTPDVIFNFADIRKALMDESINLIAIMTENNQYIVQAVKSKLGVLPYIQPGQSRKPREKENSEQIQQLTSTPATSNIETKKVDDKSTEDSQISEQAASNETENENLEPMKTHSGNYENSSEQDEIAESPLENTIISHPIRTGQRVYSKGDLTIIGSVSPGAEVIANGNIHIYGLLKGRAIAGASGDDTAKIFCQSMNAELISIAGNYKQLEEISDDQKNKRLQISLENEKICFFPL